MICYRAVALRGGADGDSMGITVLTAAARQRPVSAMLSVSW